MKISNTLIAILNSRGFCVDEMSTDCPYWGTTYQFSRGIGKSGFSVVVDSGNSLEELIARLEARRNELEDGMDTAIIDDASASESIASLNEIIDLICRWKRARCAYA